MNRVFSSDAVHLPGVVSWMQEDDMLRLTITSLGLMAALFATSANAHTPLHSECRVGPTWNGRALHFHPRGPSNEAVMCGGGRRDHPRRYRDDGYREESYRERHRERRRPPHVMEGQPYIMSVPR